MTPTTSIVKSWLKSSWQTVKTLFADYADNSTIHGVSYIAEKNRSWFEKVWWVVVLCISVLFCGKLIYDASNISPIIISFKDKPTSIWEIPFPAVTICPYTVARSDRINITKIFQDQENGGSIFQNLTERE
jgi:acid-sensing ion channel, other